MPADDHHHSRIADLRRRVDADPASNAFAQLAEEYRRLGEYEQAVACCRQGLLRHPNYLAARVTLGRALIALERYDDAAAELDAVLAMAPDHRGAAEAQAQLPPRRATSDKDASGLFDFDALLEALGQPQATPPPVMELLLSRFASAPGAERRDHQATAAAPASRPANPFAALEEALDQHAVTSESDSPASADALVLNELNAWLEVLARERQERAV